MGWDFTGYDLRFAAWFLRQEDTNQEPVVVAATVAVAKEVIRAEGLQQSVGLPCAFRGHGSSSRATLRAKAWRP